MSTDTLLLAVSTFFAMVAALSGVIAVIIAGKSLSEARATITELQQLTKAAAIETKAQTAVAERMEAVANGSTATVQMLHVTILEAGVQAEIDSLVRVATAVSEVASACLRIAGGQPEFLFTVAQENLRAALISIQDDANLQNCGAIARGRQASSSAARYVHGARAETRDALDAARARRKKIVDDASLLFKNIAGTTQG